MIESFLVFIASAYFFYRALKVTKRAIGWIHAWSTVSNLELYREASKWVVITGCTDGIGLEFARQLYTKDFNLILVSRSQEKLDGLKKELQSRSLDSSIVTLSLDFSLAYDEEAVTRKIGNRAISILINNVGVGYDKNTEFLNIPQSKIESLVQVNVTNTLLFTQTIMRRMLHGTSLVVSISSGSSLAPCPYMAVYAASKAFLNAWSEAMALEYSGRIRFQLYTPYYITSKLSHFTRETMTIPSPAAWVASALTQMGRDTTTGYPIHDMMCWILNGLMSKSMAAVYVTEANRPQVTE